jgi:hypothetical protein
MPTSYACPFCGDLKSRDLAFRCGLCSSSTIDEMDGAFFCENCGEIGKSGLSVECGICGTEELAASESAL